MIFKLYLAVVPCQLKTEVRCMTAVLQMPLWLGWFHFSCLSWPQALSLPHISFLDFQPIKPDNQLKSQHLGSLIYAAAAVA